MKYETRPMTVEVNKIIIAKSIEIWGEDAQTTVCMEECAELIQAISKEKRGKSDKNHLAEEISDVLISIEILKQIYAISDDTLKAWIEKKQKRVIDACNYREPINVIEL